MFSCSLRGALRAARAQRAFSSSQHPTAFGFWDQCELPDRSIVVLHREPDVAVAAAAADAAAATRAPRTPATAEHVLSAEEMDQIRTLRQEDPWTWTTGSLAKKFGVSRLAVSKAARCPRDKRLHDAAGLEAKEERRRAKIRLNRKGVPKTELDKMRAELDAPPQVRTVPTEGVIPVRERAVEA